MNITQIETPIEIEAKTCGHKYNKRVISYHFVESSHSLCIDRREIILAQIKACERLLRHTKNKESLLVKREISDLKLALDLIHY